MIPENILHRLIHGAWQGVIKIEEFIVVDKQVIKYSAGEGPTYALIIKDIKKDKHYKIEYVVLYKKSVYIHDKVLIKPVVEVYPEKQEVTVYKTEKELLENIDSKFEEIWKKNYMMG